MIKCTWYYGASSKDMFKRNVEEMKRCGLSKVLFYSHNEASIQTLWDFVQSADLEIHMGFEFEKLYHIATRQLVPRAVLSNIEKFETKFSREIKEGELKCWSSIKNIDKIILYLKNLIKNYPFLKGINIDALRYPNTIFQEDFPCECEGCQERRKPWLGCGVLKEEDLKDPSIMYKEIETKIQVITKFAKELALFTQTAGLEFSISARAIYAGRDIEFNPLPTWGYGPAIYEGQDWVAWCRDKILNAIHFMNYSTGIDRFKQIARQHRDLLQGCSVTLCEGLGVSSSAGKMSPKIFGEEIELTKSLGISGITVFSWSAMTEEHMHILERV